jgi:hypothetical protein
MHAELLPLLLLIACQVMICAFRLRPIRGRMGPVRIPLFNRFGRHGLSQLKLAGGGSQQLIAHVQDTVRDNIAQHNLQNSSFLLCVSGGCDSMALLHSMAALLPSGPGKDLRGHMAVLNFNHKKRAESDEEVLVLLTLTTTLVSYGC